MMSDEFQAHRAKIVEALNDPSVSTGVVVAFGASNCYIAGNLAHDDPALSPVYADDLGRLWKERHVEGAHEMVCILDLRVLMKPLLIVEGDPPFNDDFPPRAPGAIEWLKRPS